MAVNAAVFIPCTSLENDLAGTNRKEVAMYTLVIEHHPAPGKVAELRSAVEERAKASNAAGRPQAILEQVMAADPAIVAAIRFDSMAGLEADLAARASDSAYQAQVQKIRNAVSRPQQPMLTENLVTAQPSGPIGNVLTVRLFAAPGKAGELSQVLQETSQAPAAAGLVGAGLSTEVVAEEGVNFTMNLLFSNLAGFEQWRAAVRTDGTLATFGQKTAGLVSRPASQRLFRVVVPFPTS